MLSSFVLNDSGSSRTSPSRLPRMFVEYQPVIPEQPRLQAGRDDRLDQRLPRLEILPRQRRLVSRGQRDQRRNVGREIGRRVRVRNALANGRVGVDHARRDGRIVLLERALEALDGRVRRRLGHEDFGAAAPDHHQPIEVVVGLELADVGDHLLGEILLVLALLDVRTVEALHVPLIEHRRPGTNLFELGPDLLEQRRLDDAGRPRGGVAVVFENVPAAEHEIVEAGERHDLADFRRAAFGALAETDGAHLRQRADRFGDSLANGEDAGDRRGADGAEADEQHAQLAARGSDFYRCRHGAKLYQFSVAQSTSRSQLTAVTDSVSWFGAALDGRSMFNLFGNVLDAATSRTCSSSAWSASKLGERFAQIGCAHGGRLGAVAAKVGLVGTRRRHRARRSVGRARAEGRRAGRRARRNRNRAADRAARRRCAPSISWSSTTPAGCSATCAADDRARPRSRSCFASCGQAAGRSSSASSPRSGLGALLERAPRERSFAARGALHDVAAADGFRPVRTLAERDGLMFVEASSRGRSAVHATVRSGAGRDSPGAWIRPRTDCPAREHTPAFTAQPPDRRKVSPQIGRKTNRAVRRAASRRAGQGFCLVRPEKHQCKSTLETTPIRRARSPWRQVCRKSRSSPSSAGARYVPYADAVRVGRAVRRDRAARAARDRPAVLDLLGVHVLERVDGARSARRVEHAARGPDCRRRVHDDVRADAGRDNRRRERLRSDAARLRRVCRARAEAAAAAVCCRRHRRRRPSAKGAARISSPLPVRVPPQPIEPVPHPPEPKPEPLKAEPLPLVVAPIVAVPADSRSRIGILEQTTAEADSHGPGTGRRRGHGRRHGNRRRRRRRNRAGIGWRHRRRSVSSGSGIEPPRLLREVKAGLHRRGPPAPASRAKSSWKSWSGGTASVGDLKILQGLGRRTQRTRRAGGSPVALCRRRGARRRRST